MSFHLALWSESVDQAAIAPIAALADPALTVSGDNIQVPDFGAYLMGAYAAGVNLTRAQLQSPSLRRITNPEIRPFDLAATPSSYPPIYDLMRNPIPLDVGEQMQAYAAEDGAGATQMLIAAWLGDGKVDVITDPIFSVRATAATLLASTEWKNGGLTFDQVLPVGDYGIVGARCESTNIVAFRFVFQGSTPRPGGLGLSSGARADPIGQRFGGWGLWGVFNSTTPPTVDLYALAANASEVLTLDLIKIG